MGIVDSFKEGWKKSRTTGIVFKYLDHNNKYRIGKYDSRKLSKDLVDKIWAEVYDLARSKGCYPPQDIVIAAIAITHGIGQEEESPDNRQAMILALGNIISELSANEEHYKLKEVELQLLQIPIIAFNQATQPYVENEQIMETVERMDEKQSSWEEWLEAFKKEAEKENSVLQINSEGRSFIDFMDLEPLKKAFNEGYRPEPIAQAFARDFDINQFGK